MADPQGYIEINDFSPGIHSSLHGTTAPQRTAGIGSGPLIGNGVAAPGTYNCRADKTGALIPMPDLLPTGPRDSIRPTLDLVAGRPWRYVLDAHVGNKLVDATEVAGAPIEPDRRMIHVVWGMFVVPD